MGLDARIPLMAQGIQTPDRVNMLSQALQLQGLQRQNALADMQMQEQRATAEERGALRNFLARPGVNLDAPETQAELYRTAPTQAPAILKGRLETRKLEGEISHKSTETEAAKARLKHETFVRSLQQLGGVSSPEQATQWLNEQVQGGQMSMQTAQQQMLALRNPETFDQWKRGMLMRGVDHAKQIEMTLPKYERQDTGGGVTVLQMNPLAGPVGAAQGVPAIPKTQSPDSIASNQTTRRGQDLVNQRAADANRIKAQEVENSKESGLPVLGVPKPAVLPWSNQSNPKDANKVKASEMSRGSKEIEKDVDAARKEAATAQAAARFIELNKNVPTGGLSDKVGAGRWLQSMGSDYAELESITAKLAPAMREPGSGSTSDFDGKQFERATVSVEKPKAANENIANAIIARAQLSQDYADFRQTYLEQNGTLQGADRYWKDYVNKNPIFNTQKPGSFELNKNRRPWSEHFKAGTEKAPAAAPAASPAAPKVLRFDAQGNLLTE